MSSVMQLIKTPQTVIGSVELCKAHKHKQPPVPHVAEFAH